MKQLVPISNCPDCGKSYTNKFNMKRHYALAHLHVRKFVCEVCGRSLSSKQNYKEHAYTHTGEKPFKCPDCGVRYRQSSQLSVHRRVHRELKKTMDQFQTLKLTDMLCGRSLENFHVGEIKTASKLFEATPLPALDHPNPNVLLSVFLFLD